MTHINEKTSWGNSPGNKAGQQRYGKQEKDKIIRPRSPKSGGIFHKEETV